MPRPPKTQPERGDARTRLLDAARDVIRGQGFAATTVDQLCRTAGVTKGAFFHHFEDKTALGVAAAVHWAETTTAFFDAAPYHRLDDPLERLLGYVAFRKTIIDGGPDEFSCLVGTMTQEVYASHPAIRDACAASIFGHAATLEPDIRAAMAARGMTTRGKKVDWTPASLAAYLQAVLQGAFILAKATDNRTTARDCVDHLYRYLQMLFAAPAAGKAVPQREGETT